MSGPDAAVAAFLTSLPGRRKAELHVHLEGCAAPATLVRLGRRNGGGPFPDLGAFRRRRRFDGSGGFLEFYRDVCRSLRSPEDYALVARDFCRRLSRERIVYAEVWVSPTLVERIGLPWPPVRDAIERVFSRWEARTGGRVVVLVDAVRHWGPEAAARALDLAGSWSRAAGFGLGGDEASVPARDFAAVYRRARAAGLAPLVHAGEWAGPESVAEALRWLGPVRLAHGVRAIEDPGLVRRLARAGVALDVAIGSNLATGAVFPLARHPVVRLLRAGVRVSLSTDDPSLFGTTLAAEFRRLARLGATARELRAVLAAPFSLALRPAHPRRPYRSPASTRS